MRVMKIYIIGSVNENEYSIKCVATRFEKLGHEVRYVKKEHGVPLETLIHTCFLTIESWADLVVVVPKQIYPTLEISDGTKYEMEHASSYGKPVLINYL